MVEIFETLGYFASFWMLCFNRTYREARLVEWREAATWERAFILLEGCISFAVGVVLPGAILWAIASHTIAN